VPPPVPGRFYAPKLLEQVEDAQRREAEAYLAEVAERLRADRLRVETHVLMGEAALAIVQFAEHQGCHMIVMCSHGMGGLAKQVFGSVSQKVLYASTRPVLIIRPSPPELEREEEFEERAADEAILQELSARNKPS
jgi:nucleotide-binding universal stress UspA family protein